MRVIKEREPVKKSVLGMLLALSLTVSTGIAFAEGGEAVGAAAMFNEPDSPLGKEGAVGGAFGATSGAIEGAIDMEKRVFKSQGRSEEDGYVQANYMTWPFDVVQGVVVAPVGALMGLPKGLAKGFKAGWNVWGDGLPGQTSEYSEGE